MTVCLKHNECIFVLKSTRIAPKADRLVTIPFRQQGNCNVRETQAIANIGCLAQCQSSLLAG